MLCCPLPFLKLTTQLISAQTPTFFLTYKPFCRLHVVFTFCFFAFCLVITWKFLLPFSLLISFLCNSCEYSYEVKHGLKNEKWCFCIWGVIGSEAKLKWSENLPTATDNSTVFRKTLLYFFILTWICFFNQL